MERINYDKILKIKVQDILKARYSWRAAKPEKKFLGIVISCAEKEGFYWNSRIIEYRLESFKNYIVIGKELFHKPKVVFSMSDGISSEKQFNTYKEAVDWVSIHFDEIKFRIIT